MKYASIVLLALIFVLAVGAGYLGYLYFGGVKKATLVPTPASQTTSTNQTVSLTGTIVDCLPIKPGDPYKETDGCASGFQANDGSYYVLLGVDNINLLNPGIKISVSGQIDTGFNSHYDVKGAIKVTDIKAL